MSSCKEGQVFSREMTNTLLDHLDDNKGPHGMYMNEAQRAFADAADHISTRHSPVRVSKTQVERKFRAYTQPRDRRHPSRTTLFNSGSSALPIKHLAYLGRKEPDRRIRPDKTTQSKHSRVMALPRVSSARLAKDVANNRLRDTRSQPSTDLSDSPDELGDDASAHQKWVIEDR